MPPREHRLAGALAVLAGVCILVLVDAFPQGLKAPAWVVICAAAAFILAGVSLLARGPDAERWKAWLAVALLATMLAPGAWIAFGAGDRRCRGSIPLLSAWVGRARAALFSAWARC